MSGNFHNDNKFSDDCIASDCLKKSLIKSGLFGKNIKYDDKSGTKLDTDNNIDGYLNGVPVQMHMQRPENIKGSIDYYCAFIKYKRNKTGAETELTKIINNKRNKKPYPKYIIWAIIDSDNFILHKIQIIDVKKMLRNLKNNKKEYIKENDLDEVDGKFYKNSKYYKTFYNPEDGTEPLFLKTDEPVHEDTPFIPFEFDD